MTKKYSKAWLKEQLNYYANSASMRVNKFLEEKDISEATRCLGELDVIRSLAFESDIKLDID